MKKVFKPFLLPVIYGAIVTLLLLMPVLLCVPIYAGEDEAECWAVIVGVSDYEELPDLNYCDDDARGLSNELSPVWGDDHIEVLTNSMATKRGIENAVTDWLASREGANDTVLFFFSGHGGWEYVCPHDSLTQYYDNDIFGEELDSWLNTLDSEKIIVITDSCVSGTFLKEVSRNGRVILTACSPDEEAYDDSILEHGVFSYYITEAFSEFEASDTNDNSELSIEEIFEYARTRTTNYTQYKEYTQHPLIRDDYAGELSLIIKVTADVKTDMAQNLNILNIAGENYSLDKLPVSFIWAAGSSHDFEAFSTVSGGSGTEYLFDSWHDGNTSASREISQGGVYTANYTTRYHLTVESEYGNPQGEGWYESGSTATISVTSPEGGIIRQVFTGWSGDSSATTPSASVNMNRPKTVTASWRTDYVLLFIIVGVVSAVLVGGIVAVMTIMRKRRGKRIAAPAIEKRVTQPPTATYCKNCGAEIKPGDDFCTRCGKAVKE
jgi:uncharacterized repeat protein (TIGR02543 family)